MARHWLPVQGFDEDLADRVFGVSVGKFEAMSNAEEVEEVSMYLLYICLLAVSIFRYTFFLW